MLFTRHTLGTIEADQDRRAAARGRTGRRHHASAPDLAADVRWPRMTAALRAVALAAAEAEIDTGRWADEGGTYEREAAQVLVSAGGPV
jgi:hypothetical protein